MKKVVYFIFNFLLLLFLFNKSILAEGCTISTPACVDAKTYSIPIVGTNVENTGSPYNGDLIISLGPHRQRSLAINGSFNALFSIDPNQPLAQGVFPVIVNRSWTNSPMNALLPNVVLDELCNTTIEVVEKCNPALQGQMIGPDIKVEAQKCQDSTPDNPKLATALGCIPTSPVDFIDWLFKLAVGLGSGIAFLLMAWGSILLVTAQGNPEQIKAGKDTFVSAGAGLLFIIFAIFIMRFIGADIIKIPGFINN